MELMAQRQAFSELKRQYSQSKQRNETNNEKEEVERGPPLLSLGDTDIAKVNPKISEPTVFPNHQQSECEKGSKMTNEDHSIGIRVSDIIEEKRTNNSNDIWKNMKPDFFMESVRSNVHNFSEKVSTFQNLRPFETKATRSEKKDSSKSRVDDDGHDSKSAMNLKLIRLD